MTDRIPPEDEAGRWQPEDVIALVAVAVIFLLGIGVLVLLWHTA